MAPGDDGRVFALTATSSKVIRRGCALLRAVAPTDRGRCAAGSDRGRGGTCSKPGIGPRAGGGFGGLGPVAAAFCWRCCSRQAAGARFAGGTAWAVSSDGKGPDAAVAGPEAGGVDVVSEGLSDSEDGTAKGG